MGKQTLLRKLAPFLPCGIFVNYQFQDKQDYKNWVPVTQKLDPQSLYHFMYDYSVERRNIKPLLRSFSQLTATILHEGKEVIPAVEVARLAQSGSKAWYVASKDSYSVILKHETKTTSVEILSNFDVRVYSNASRLYTINQVAIIDLLRSMHFAVGFDSSEFIEKEVQNG